MRKSHPDHDTLATFRRRFLSELEGLFIQVLEMAKEMKLIKLGTIRKRDWQKNRRQATEGAGTWPEGQ